MVLSLSINKHLTRFRIKDGNGRSFAGTCLLYSVNPETFKEAHCARLLVLEHKSIQSTSIEGKSITKGLLEPTSEPSQTKGAPFPTKKKRKKRK